MEKDMKIEVAIEIEIAGQKIAINDDEAMDLYMALKSRCDMPIYMSCPVYPSIPWPEYPVITYTLNSNGWHV